MIGNGKPVKVRVNALSYAKLISCLYHRPCSQPYLAECTGLHIWTVRHYIRALYKEKMVHISSWLPDSMGRDAIAVFSFGPGIDKKRRVKATHERAYAYKLKRKEKEKHNELQRLGDSMGSLSLQG